MAGVFEQMAQGGTVDALDPALQDLRDACARATAVFAGCAADDHAALAAALRGVLGAVGEGAVVVGPLFAEFGVNVTLGDHAFVNTGAVFLDCAPVVLKAHVMVGPGVQFLTAGHPLMPEARKPPCAGTPGFRVMTQARPITVGEGAWIGGGTILLPGVEVGAGAVVGAGSVVTRSVPPRVLALGNPARVVRPL